MHLIRLRPQVYDYVGIANCSIASVVFDAHKIAREIQTTGGPSREGPPWEVCPSFSSLMGASETSTLFSCKKSPRSRTLPVIRRLS